LMEEAVVVLGNVPKLHVSTKLHGLIGIGILAAVIAAPIGCSDDSFSGCRATRTCPPSKGGSAGEGGEGDTGGTTNTGGSSGSGTSGEAGASDGGTAGSGGAGDDTERPTIVSFTPADNDVDIERDIEVTAELSEPIDEASVTNESVTLSGPDGEVSGTLSVNENVISFVPDKTLYLLGNYTFTIDETIADLAGNTLAESASVEFQVRDGRWGTITTPFGRTPRRLNGYARNSRGDVVIAGGQPTEPAATLWTAIYNASENRWSPVETLTPSQESSLPYDYRGVSIDDARRATLTWFGTSAGWFRYSENDGWEDAGPLPQVSAVVATSDGAATAIWSDQGSLNTRTLDLDTGSLGEMTPLWSSLASGSDLQAVASQNRVALFERTPAGPDMQITVAWRDPVSGWGDREPIASANGISGIWSAQGDAQGNISVIWVQGNELWSRIYQRGDDVWTRPVPVMTGANGISFGFPRMAYGNVAMQVYVDSTAYAAYYQQGVGWIENSIVDLANLGVGNFTEGFGVEMSIDDRGNMLAVGHAGYRRYIPGEGWRPAAQHHLDLGPWRMWMLPAPDGSAVAVTHEELPDYEMIPKVVRFE
jgi:hypothetical protein